MRQMFGVLLLGVGVCAVPSAASAAPITINFATTGAVGDLGTSTFSYTGQGLGSTPLVVTGYYLHNGVWTAADLFRRNDGSNDVGFGVCNPIEGAGCGTGTGDGDINELDDAGQRELIRLTLPVGYTWVSVGVSSLDDNGGARLLKVDGFSPTVMACPD